MKTLNIIALSLVLVGCGSRTMTTERNNQKSKTQMEITTEEIKSETDNTTQTKKETEQSKSQKIEEKSQNVAQLKTEQKNAQNSVQEAGSKSQIDKFYRENYYPNGQLKSKTETSRNLNEAYSKLKLENEYLRSSAVALVEERDLLTEELKTEKQANEELTQKLTKSEGLNIELKEENKMLKEDKNKATERENSWELYILLAGLGFLGGFLVDRFIFK